MKPEHCLFLKLNEPPELLLGDGLYAEILDAMEMYADEKNKAHPFQMKGLEWISIERLLPDHTGDVIVLLDDKTIMMGRYRKSGGGFWALYFSDTGLQFDEYKSSKVTHWIPLIYLPELP
jgi:hypothetical protein